MLTNLWKFANHSIWSYCTTDYATLHCDFRNSSSNHWSSPGSLHTHTKGGSRNNDTQYFSLVGVGPQACPFFYYWLIHFTPPTSFPIPVDIRLSNLITKHFKKACWPLGAFLNLLHVRCSWDEQFHRLLLISIVPRFDLSKSLIIPASKAWLSQSCFPFISHSRSNLTVNKYEKERFTELSIK